MNFFKVLPIAIVMIAGPQIVSAILLATSERARRCSFAFLAGLTIAITLGYSIAYFVSKAVASGYSSSEKSGLTPLDYGIVALLLIGMILVFRSRKNPNPPKWMTKLQAATPKFAFGLGFLLFLLMPTDIIGYVTVGAFLARHADPWWHGFGFIGLTMLLAGTPLLILLLLGKRADTLLPKMRDWMNTKSWIVSEVVLVFFIAMTLAG